MTNGNFMLFAYSSYYPYGGHGDYVGRFDSLDTAYKVFMEHEDQRQHASIYDIDNDYWFESHNRKEPVRVSLMLDPVVDAFRWMPAD